MANWGITDMIPVPVVLAWPLMVDRDVDAATAFLNQPTSPPTGALRYSRQSNRWEEYDGTGNWIPKVLAVSGGGTGSADAPGARANLGIGTMGVQSAAGVAITGGVAILSGLTMKGHILFNDAQAYDIGTTAKRANRVYVGGGLVAPVGVDKWVPV